jgi:Replication initiator protein A
MRSGETPGMTQPSARLPRPVDRLLLGEQGASTLPSPISLQLLDIPVVLPVQKQPEPVNGRLPEAFWRVEFELVGADRTRYRVRVTGDPQLGLPYGRDADVLLALFRILDEERDVHDLATGTFVRPSFQAICRALGLGATGPLVRRVRDALRRLANVRVESRVLVDRSREAASILSQDGSTIAAPTASTVRRHEVEESRWLLEYRTEERTVEERPAALHAGRARPTEAADDPKSDASGTRDSDADGPIPSRVERTLFIHELKINPFWVGQAISGWAGWIDVERHADLKSITARRLYQLCAAHAARHVRLPWVFSEVELRAACMMTIDAKKPTRVRQMLTDAAEELVALGVLSSHTWHGAPRRGPMEFVLEPGPLLQLSGLLRGVGLSDPPDVRVQYALLRRFGVSAMKARAMIAEKPGQVADVLLRACHLRATDPSAVKKSWAGWVIHHVDNDTSFVGEVAFQQWRKTALAKLDRASELQTLAAATGAAVPPIHGPERAARSGNRPLPDPDAAGRWSAALESLRPELSILDLYGIEDAVAVGGGQVTIDVEVSDDIAAKALQRLLPRIEEALLATEGRAVTVSVVVSPTTAGTRGNGVAPRNADVTATLQKTALM